MEKEDQRNFILAMVLMVAFMFGYQALVLEPDAKRRRAAAEAAEAARVEAEIATPTPEVEGVEIAANVDDALGARPRVAFDGGAIDGSIRLEGARIDDLNLKRHFATTAREAELRLLRPERAGNGYYSSWYWLDEDGRSITSASAEWTQIGTGSLTPSTPIKLRYAARGFAIEREIALDDDYLFTFTDTVTNNRDIPRVVAPYGSVRRHGDYKAFLELSEPGGNRNSALVFQGLIGVLNGKLELTKYKPLSEGKTAIDKDPISHDGGWLGFTDKYWMTALAPDQSQEFTAGFRRRNIDGQEIFEASTQGAALTVPAGGSITVTNHVFAGAKELAALNKYKHADGLGLPRFDDAVDWGFLYFLTKPFFTMLAWLKGITGSFGLAILAFVVIVKLILFPLYNRSYAAMAKMRKLQEPMKEIQERFAGDPQRRQQEIMKLYREEKANPIAGCLPILATIPIFFALYKTLIVTLEMRHAPFLYMLDLSQPDPTAIGNLFGLLPWSAELVKDVPLLGLIIGIGFLPLMYGLTTFITQSLNPPPADPMQRRIMLMLPVVFMFVFAGFAGGLVLYWVWNNVLSCIQQYIIMRRNGVRTEFDKWLARRLGRAEPET